MSWLKKEVAKVKKQLQRQARGETRRILDLIRAWQPQTADGLDEYHSLLVLLRNSAFCLAGCPHFHEEAVLLWKLAYDGPLPETDKISLIRSQLPQLCGQIEQHRYTIQVSREAKAVYFAGHDYTRKRLKKRDQALASVLQALQDAVRQTGEAERAYTEFQDRWAELPLDQPEVTAPFYERLVQTVRNFSSWQPVFAKINGAEGLAHTLSEYEQSAADWQEDGNRWQQQCRQYFEGEAQLVAGRRALAREAAAYEHSGAFGGRPVFDFSRRGHRLEAHKQTLLDQEDSLDRQYAALQDSYQRLCSRILNSADELCDYVVVLRDCLEGERKNNRTAAERLEAEYEAAQQEISSLDDEYATAGQVKAQLAAAGEEAGHGI